METMPSESCGEKIICWKCKCELVRLKVGFNYLGHFFSTELLACPECRQSFVPEQLAKGQMAEVEYMLEDK
jgi:hypothetical protein